MDSNPLEFPSFADQVTRGNHVLELEMLEGNMMPYSVVVEYNSLHGISSQVFPKVEYMTHYLL